MPLFNDVLAQIITSAAVPNNPTQGLIWNELDSNGGLIETWSYTNLQWRSAYKSLSTGISGSGSGGMNFNNAFSFDDKYNIFLDKATIKLASTVAITTTNYLSWYLLRSQFLTINQFSINNLAANTNYQNTISLSQVYSFDTTNNNLNLFMNRINVNGGTYSFHSSTSFSYRLIRK